MVLNIARKEASSVTAEVLWVFDSSIGISVDSIEKKKLKKKLKTHELNGPERPGRPCGTAQ